MKRKTASGHELLLEIGTEELPAQFVPPALAGLEVKVAQLLKDARLAHGTVKTVGTPRRLTLWVQGVAEHQEPISMEVMGPSKAVGFDAQGQPTKAAIGFAASQGVTVKALVARTMPKGEYLFAVKKAPGRKTTILLPGILADLVGGLSFPKAMRWNETGARFARPVRWLLALHAGKPVTFQFGGLTAGDSTYGHRFLSSGRPVRVKDFRSYEKDLKKAGVIVDHERRREMIDKQFDSIDKNKKIKGRVVRNNFLREQAVFSVETPNAIIGSFDSKYLDLPQDVLSIAMKEHQGYFTLLATDGRLLPYFVAVVNMRGSETTIRAGNERVLAARLADAKFFFDEDCKTRLESRVEKLKGVIFHQKLGTLHQKTGRIMALAAKLADTLGDDLDTIEHCRRAAMLCKADLVTGMVGEFPALQGTMGAEYALHDGEPKAVAHAITEHYMPRSADDGLPGSLAGKILSLADRLDTLAAFFAVGLVPSGSQDPFALRRHAYAVIRILVDGGLHLSLNATIQDAVRLLKEQGVPVEDKVAGELQRFFGERLRYYTLGLRGDLVEAVLARWQSGTFDPLDLLTRTNALETFAERPEFESLVIAYKRTENITKSHTDDKVDPATLREEAEKGLYKSVCAAEDTVPGLIKNGEYEGALEVLASLKVPIDAFFVGVMVMAEEEAIRRNRLALLIRVRNLFRQYADFSKVNVETK